MASPFGRAVLVVDPRAGRGAVGREMPEVERQLLARKLDYRIEETAGPGDAARIVREGLAEGDRFFVAVGGDDTVQAVVGGLLDDGRPGSGDTVLGVVAAGSGADFPRTFGLPGDAIRAVRHLTGDRTYTIDAMRITHRAGGADRTRFSAGVAQVGLGAATVARTERLPEGLGGGRRLLGFWLALARFRVPRLDVQVDRRSWEGKAWNVVVGNCQFAGGGLRVSPKSYPQDGLIDVLVHHGPKSDAFTDLPKVYRGEQVPSPHIAEYRGRVVRVVADRPVPVEADGQVVGTTPASFEILPEALSLKI